MRHRFPQQIGTGISQPDHHFAPVDRIRHNGDQFTRFEALDNAANGGLIDRRHLHQLS
ncbi:hypothetical protein D3C71_1814590 [compost metagenome]